MVDVEIHLSELDLRKLMQGGQFVFEGTFATVTIEKDDDLYVSEMVVIQQDKSARCMELLNLRTVALNELSLPRLYLWIKKREVYKV